MSSEDVPPGPILVDTDVFSAILWNKDGREVFEALLHGRVLCLSFATVGELRAGALKAKAPWGPDRTAKLEGFISLFVVLPSTDLVVHRWAALYARFRDQLKGGGVNDMWTAACSLAQEQPLPIATLNLSDFQTMAKDFPFPLVHPDI